MEYTFIEVRPFLDRREACFDGDEDFRNFQNELAAKPTRWGVIPGCAPLRKARWRGKESAKGKSGGCRVIYMQIPEIGVIFLVHVYPKSRKDNLSQKETQTLRRLARVLRDEILAQKGWRK